MMTAPTFQIQMLPRAAVPTQQFRPRSRSFPFPCNHSIRKCAAKKVSAVASDADEIALLEKMLKLARERKEKEKRKAREEAELKKNPPKKSGRISARAEKTCGLAKH